jgi:soluble lytic murein transglycosylase-like protein
MAARCSGGAAGSSPAPRASARSGRLEADGAFEHARRRLSLVILTASTLLASLSLEGAATGQTLAPIAPSVAPIHGVTIADSIVEASQRFGVPEAWIRAVMRIESGGQAHVTSPKGAMGLMQLMPATWANMRARLGLGADPYDPHDNVIAGVAFLRQMYDEFGPEGFLAAYNEGPGRYLAQRRAGLPPLRTTQAYVAAITSKIGLPVGPAAIPLRQIGSPAAHNPTIFVALGRSASTNQPAVDATPLAPATAPTPATSTLFAVSRPPEPLR